MRVCAGRVMSVAQCKLAWMGVWMATGFAFGRAWPQAATSISVRDKTGPKPKGRLAPLRDVGTVRRWSSTLGPRHASGGTGLCSGIIPAALATSTPTLAHDHLL